MAGEQSMAEQDPSEEQVLRGAAALHPFVEAWGLPLNPEGLQLMAGAVLKYAAEESGDYDAIATGVRELIDQDAEQQQEMRIAMEQDSNLTAVFGTYKETLLEHIRSARPDSSAAEIRAIADSLISEATAFMSPADAEDVFAQAVAVFDSYQETPPETA